MFCLSMKSGDSSCLAFSIGHCLKKRGSCFKMDNCNQKVKVITKSKLKKTASVGVCLLCSDDDEEETKKNPKRLYYKQIASPGVPAGGRGHAPTVVSIEFDFVFWGFFGGAFLVLFSFFEVFFYLFRFILYIFFCWSFSKERNTQKHLMLYL